MYVIRNKKEIALLQLYRGIGKDFCSLYDFESQIVNIFFADQVDLNCHLVGEEILLDLTGVSAVLSVCT